MPCAVDYILEGLAKNLELERELGRFSLDFDRDFLVSLPKERVAQSANPGSRGAEGGAGVKAVDGRRTADGHADVVAAGKAGGEEVLRSAGQSKGFDFVFLHHGPIAGPGVEMMAKLVTAMKQTPESAPIVFAGEKPVAKIYIVLGMKALKQWYDGVTIGYCGWFRDVGSEVLLVYSPEEIYRFGTKLSAAMIQKKREMWSSLQEAMRKVCRS